MVDKRPPRNGALQQTRAPKPLDGKVGARGEPAGEEEEEGEPHMNWKRLSLSALVAGTIMLISQIVLHVFVLAEQGTAMVDDWAGRGLDASSILEPSVPLTLALYLLAFVCVCAYVAARRFLGPGPRTALCAGVAVWAVSHLFAAIYIQEGIAILPTRLVWLPAAWTLVEVPLATLAGAWLYRD
jgi:hypothetical protein